MGRLPSLRNLRLGRLQHVQTHQRVRHRLPCRLPHLLPAPPRLNALVLRPLHHRHVVLRQRQHSPHCVRSRGKVPPPHLAQPRHVGGSRRALHSEVEDVERRVDAVEGGDESFAGGYPGDHRARHGVEPGERGVRGEARKRDVLGERDQERCEGEVLAVLDQRQRELKLEQRRPKFEYERFQHLERRSPRLLIRKCGSHVSQRGTDTHESDAFSKKIYRVPQVIETERVRFRRFRSQDFEQIQAAKTQATVGYT
mmetsp:Transcript_20629/g.55069  ORF Transcript_20629/g.55069 Transcript_20629/m.55069 type:complete len:254 (-) Transcript_20629:1300-2061(-)